MVAEKSPGGKSNTFDFVVKERPKQFNKKVGKNVIVPVFLKNIIPISTSKEMYPNICRKTKCKFIVGEIKKMN